MAVWQHDGLAGHPPVELKESDDRTGEGNGTDGQAKRHFDQARPVNMAVFDDAESLRRVKRTGSHKNRRKPNQGVKRSHKLGHIGHFDGFSAPCAKAAADTNAADNHQPAHKPGRRGQQQRGEHGKPHADHAIEVSLSRRGR